MQRLMLLAAIVVAIASRAAPAAQQDAATGSVKVGDKAQDFTLQTLSGENVRLWSLTARGPVAVVILRGYPGYQCPMCNSQVADWMAHAKQFESRGAQVLLVYPGKAEQLRDHAREFLSGKDLPSAFTLLTDPDYKFVSAYGLRWDAANETAYPSTLVIDSQNTIRLAKVSKTHGDRASAEEVLATLPKAAKP